MIGIIAALRHEIESLAGEMKNVKSERVGSIDFIRGEIDETEVVCAVCGVGKVFAAMCAEAMILRYAPSLIINTGAAGTLTADLSIGDIAVASAVCQHDMDTSALGDEVGMVSGPNLIYFETDKAASDKIISIAESVGCHTVSGVIATGDRFIAENDDRARIRAAFNAVSCEMEGGAVGQVCHANGVPFAIVRAISDSADGEAVEDYPAFAAFVSERSCSILCELARGM